MCLCVLLFLFFAPLLVSLSKKRGVGDLLTQRGGTGVGLGGYSLVERGERELLHCRRTGFIVLQTQLLSSSCVSSQSLLSL